MEPTIGCKGEDLLPGAYNFKEFSDLYVKYSYLCSLNN